MCELACSHLTRRLYREVGGNSSIFRGRRRQVLGVRCQVSGARHLTLKVSVTVVLCHAHPAWVLSNFAVSRQPAWRVEVRSPRSPLTRRARAAVAVKQSLLLTAEARRRRDSKTKGFFSASQRLGGKDSNSSRLPQRAMLPQRPSSVRKTLRPRGVNPQRQGRQFPLSTSI
jgi:hypothetical protein